MDREYAAHVARDFLLRQDFRDQFMLDSYRVSDKGSAFHVFFNKKQVARPNYCLVEVEKRSGSARMVPLC